MRASALANASRARRAIHVTGIVQGVGFRPFVYGLANRLSLGGFVKNEAGRVTIEVEGELRSVERFVEGLTSSPPPLAMIGAVHSVECPSRGETRFSIHASESDEEPSSVFVSPDVAPCGDCIAELFDATDRRYRYPFLNCTNCGPRLTIIESAPYDRARTTMAGFAMCEECRLEYEDPSHRRFHAQPTACSVCGPKLRVTDRAGLPLDAAVSGAGDLIAFCARELVQGRLAALKGLGGYHLACDARSDSAVSELRKRKHRDEKPFAIMVTDVEAARALCDVSDAEAALMLGPQRPIVLLRHRFRDGARVSPYVNPRNPFLGIMLPYTPFHHLLLRELAGVPLVMTSGNVSDEPIAYEDADALSRLGRVADFFVTHDRPILLRCDDSVTRIMSGAESLIRRSRGYAPRPLPLPVSATKTVLALGAQSDATFALARGTYAFVSHHMGDLEHYEAYRASVESIGHYERLFDCQPSIVAHDLHPDFASTRHAVELATKNGLTRVAVQHHHAHMASCMAEHGLAEPVIGVTFDGTGFGTDGAVWGGEVFVGDYENVTRAAHLRYVPMPGGEMAIREPWRMALAHLLDAGESLDPLAAIPAATLDAVRQLAERRINSPSTSSMGRLFDAVAALTGVRTHTTYEAQAAIELESAACGIASEGAYPFDLPSDGPGPIAIDTRPLVRAVANDVRAGLAPSLISRRFHDTVVDIIVAVCVRLRDKTQLNLVVLSGGVFMNALVSEGATNKLSREGFRVFTHRLVPPNDGGLSLGQVAVAVARTSARTNDQLASSKKD